MFAVAYVYVSFLSKLIGYDYNKDSNVPCKSTYLESHGVCEGSYCRKRNKGEVAKSKHVKDIE